MNLYCATIDLKDDAKALAFAKAVDEWMSFLQGRGVIGSWRLLRRKLNLAADCYRDFLLEVEVADMTQLDQAFRLSGQQSEEVETLHQAVSALVHAADFSLYRPFPDPERSERMALI
ncbi:hypothetical protein GI582_17475 [Sulfitobacter sp. BDSS02]|uniref:DUF6614 family protein n=1 Tax=Heliomarina sp. TaxID=2917556 RepID=UPI0040593D61|nr:hypothetical protein [Sulfitobacter sp. BDSS02]MBR9850818.1 hypothetical protein [Paracoccaceae bacterium]